MALTKRRDRAQGEVYHLKRIFRRLNGIYFDGAIKARIEWGRLTRKKVRRSREFGVYYFNERLIRINPVLDQPWVPLYVIESVIHHEMCHQICPEQVIDGRRIHHTPEFNRREAEFVWHTEANQWLKDHFKKLLYPPKRQEVREPVLLPVQLGLAL